MTTVCIQCIDVSKSFITRNAQKCEVLQNVSFHIACGEFVTITGRSGSGKTTLLGMLAGIESFDSGSITLFGNRLETMSESDLTKLRRESISIIFQNHNLLPSWTAVENVEASLAHRGLHPRSMRQKARAMLSSVGLDKRIDNYPAELSAGEQQRVAVARALITEPKLIIADEPVADVDPQTGLEILDLIHSFAIRQKATIVLATHGHPPERFNQRVLEVRDGTIRFCI